MALNLLLVEDNVRTRNTILAMLNTSQFTVTVAEDGLGGLNLAKKHYFDLVLTDHKMPLMDGITLIRNLNELAAYESTPLVLMTTDDVNSVRERAERVGADYVLAKPLNANKLADFLYHLRQRDIV